MTVVVPTTTDPAAIVAIRRACCHAAVHAAPELADANAADSMDLRLLLRLSSSVLPDDTAVLVAALDGVVMSLPEGSAKRDSDNNPNAKVPSNKAKVYDARC